MIDDSLNKTSHRPPKALIGQQMNLITHNYSIHPRKKLWTASLYGVEWEKTKLALEQKLDLFQAFLLYTLFYYAITSQNEVLSI